MLKQSKKRCNKVRHNGIIIALQIALNKIKQRKKIRPNVKKNCHLDRINISWSMEGVCLTLASKPPFAARLQTYFRHWRRAPLSPWVGAFGQCGSIPTQTAGAQHPVTLWCSESLFHVGLCVLQVPFYLFLDLVSSFYPCPGYWLSVLCPEPKSHFMKLFSSP